MGNYKDLLMMRMISFVYLKNQSYFLLLVADFGLVDVLRVEINTDV